MLVQKIVGRVTRATVEKKPLHNIKRVEGGFYYIRYYPSIIIPLADVGLFIKRIILCNVFVFNSYHK